MRRILATLAILASCVVYSQEVSPIVGYQFLRPSRAVELNGQFFALYQNGQVATFAKDRGQPRAVETPIGVLVIDIFTFDDLLWIRTGEGHLFFSTDQGNDWMQLSGQYNAIFANSTNQLFVVDGNGVVYRASGERANYQLERLRTLNNQPNVKSFFVRGDTIAYYTTVAFPELRISTNEGETRIPSEWVTMSRMIEMPDGSVIAEAVPFELARFAGSIIDGPQRINELIGVDIVVSVSVGRRYGKVCLGIVGGIGSVVALLADMETETPVFNTSISSATHFLPVDDSDVLVLENSGTVFHDQQSEVVTPGFLPIDDQKTNAISGLLSEIDSGRYAAIELSDSILILTGNSVYRAIRSDPLKQLGLGTFSHFIQNGDTLVCFGQNAILLSLDNGLSWASAQSSMNASYASRMKLQDSGSIVFGDRSLHLSDRSKTIWSRYTFPYPYLTMWEARSSDSLVLARGQFELFIFTRNITNDTIDASRYRPVSNVTARPFIYSVSDTIGRVAIPMGNGSSRIDRFKLVALSMNGPVDSAVVELPLPLPDDYNQFFSSSYEDTTIVFQPGSGRVYHIVEDVVIRSYSIPVGALLPFPDVRFPGGEVFFEGTSSLTLIHPPSGVKIVAHYRDMITSVLEQKVSPTDAGNLFPNPARNVVNVLFDEPVLAQDDLIVQLHSMSGAIVRGISSQAVLIREDRTGLQIDIESNPPGLYILVIRCGNVAHAYSIVILN